MRRTGLHLLIASLLSITVAVTEIKLNDVEVKNITTNQWCKHEEKFLSSSSPRNLKYATLEEAKRQCFLRYVSQDEEEIREESDVVNTECEDKDPSCPLSAAEGHCDQVFRYCRVSCNACPKDCGGITYEPYTDMYTLRRGSFLHKSNKSETSWRRCQTVVRVTRLHISRVEIYNKEDKPPSSSSNNILPRFIDGDLITSSLLRFPARNLSPLWIGVFLEKFAKIVSVVVHAPEATSKAMTRNNFSIYVGRDGEEKTLCSEITTVSTPLEINCDKPIKGRSVYLTKNTTPGSAVSWITLEIDEISVYGEVISGDLSWGVVTGIVLGVVVVGVMMTGVLFLVWRRRERGQRLLETECGDVTGTVGIGNVELVLSQEQDNISSRSEGSSNRDGGLSRGEGSSDKDGASSSDMVDQKGGSTEKTEALSQRKSSNSSTDCESFKETENV